MKNIFSLILLLGFSLSTFAQDYSNIAYYSGRRIGNSPAETISKAKQILADVQKMADAEGITLTTKNLSDKQGNSYPVLVVSTSGNSDLNREAARVSSLMSGLPLVFSPYDLSRSGAQAFFDPDGSKLGVSYEFILGESDDPSYLHELSHANTYYRTVRGASPSWSGVMKLLAGEKMSSFNSNGYTRFASVDEIEATALSLHLASAKVLELRRTLPARDFNQGKERAQAHLVDAYFSAESGYYLALQSKDLAERAMKAQPTMKKITLKVGSASRSIDVSEFIIESYERKFTGGRGADVPVANGTSYSLYWGSYPNTALLQKRLTAIIQRSTQAAAAFKAAKDCFGFVLEAPQMESANYGCIEREASKAYRIVNGI